MGYEEDIGRCAAWIDHLRDEVFAKRAPQSLEEATQRLREHLRGLKSYRVDQDERDRVLDLLGEALFFAQPALSATPGSYKRSRGKWARDALAGLTGVRSDTIKRQSRRKKNVYFVSTDLNELARIDQVRSFV